MTQIVGTLKDSAGNPITGKLIVNLAGSLIDDTTTPDTTYLPQSYTFTITAGALSITLPQSETSRITYNFQFFKTDTEGELIEPALINFNALVPNLSPVQFASLIPTGLVNDVLDTGALRVARLISTTPALAQSIGGPFPQGVYSSTTTYKFRDLVTYLNRTYISKDLNPITGVLPTVTSSWMRIPIEPEGSLILADDAPYSSAWNASGKAASQGAVYDQVEDVKSNVALKANLISPIFSGDVIVPNLPLGDASNKAANTNFVAAVLADINTTINTKANLASPALTETPTAPTAANGTSTTQLATTAFVQQSGRPVFCVLKDANAQTLTTVGSSVDVTWTTELVDTNSAFSSTAFTVPAGLAGTYVFNLMLYLGTAGATTASTVRFNVNGVAVRRLGEETLAIGQASIVSASWIIPLSVGNVCSINVRLSSGGSTVIGFAATNAPEILSSFSGYRLAG
jgi:hypothetical protein